MRNFLRSVAAVVGVLAVYASIVGVGQNGSSTVLPSNTERLEAAEHPSLTITRRDALAAVIAGPYPDRGVMLGRRGLGGGGDWTVVDFDRLVIEHFVVGLARDGQLAVNEDSRAWRSLSADEMVRIVGETKAVRDSPLTNPGSPKVVPTDIQCDVVLLDGDDVRVGRDGTCPAGTEHLVGMLQSLGEPAPVQPPRDAAPRFERNRWSRDR